MKLSITKEKIAELAEIAKIALSEEETESIFKDGNELLKQMDKMLSMELDNVEPTINVLDITTPLREDMVRPSLSADEALKNSSLRDKEFFKVPKVLDSVES